MRLRGLFSAGWASGFLLVLSATPVLAEPGLPVLRGAVAGELSPAFDGASARRGELVQFDAQLIPSLIAAQLEQPIRVIAWPVAAGAREDVVLTRFDVYAPDAKIYGFRDGRPVEVGRSRWIFFQGRAEGSVRRDLLVILDPEDRSLSGFAESAWGRSEFRRAPGRDGNVVLVADPELFLTPAERVSQQQVSCGQEDLPPQPRSLFEALSDTPGGSEPKFLAITGMAISTLHRATIAVDTDTEFFHRKWGVVSTAQYQTNATNFMASLIAGMTVIYERDLLVRLVQGTTFLRTPPVGNESNYTTDPYTVLGSGASFGQLQEFSNYWSGGCGGTCNGVARALTMLISGKSTSGASGIAWLTGLCSTSIGYSFSQLFINSSTTASVSEARLVGHELGHNFGSPHTHCYSPPIDNCYNAEPGCYTGATSCPASTTINGVTNVRGTIMSYCHILGGCTASSVFHAGSVTLLQPKIQSAVNSCIFPLFGVTAVAPITGPAAGGTPITISGDGFVSGGSLAVSVGGAAATSVVRQNATTITAVTPAHAAGTVSVSVTNGDGAVQVLSNSYFYSPAAVASDFFTLAPCRLIDTRNPNGPLGGPALVAGAERSFTVPPTCGVPVTAKSISANLTIVSPGVTGAVSVFPGNAIYLGTSEISFAVGLTRANNAVVKLATDGTGTIKVRNLAGAAVQFVLDVNGYFE